jgi:hypothetical protein
MDATRPKGRVELRWGPLVRSARAGCEPSERLGTDERARAVVLRGLVGVAPAGQPPERPDQAEVPDGVSGLGAVMGLEVGHEIERPTVVGAVVDAAQPASQSPRCEWRRSRYERVARPAAPTPAAQRL